MTTSPHPEREKMKRPLRTAFVTAFLLVSTAGFPVGSAPAQTEILPSAGDGKMQKWEDPELGMVCLGNCPGMICCHVS
jgi:hypothetical protein